jgi:hypothetical protein
LYGNSLREEESKDWRKDSSQTSAAREDTIQEPKNTIITDQQKGSIPALADVLPDVVNFFLFLSQMREH